MQNRFILTATIAAAVSVSAFAAHAQGNFATVSNANTVAMSAEQMAKVEGKQHIYLLVEYRGVELPAQAELATQAAAPKPMGGDFLRSPSREATAFNFLN